MINRNTLLSDLQKFLQRIEADLLERSESTEVPEVPAALHTEYEKAAKAERTAQNYEDWRTDTITQAAAAWVLSCVFVRFLEDNSLVDPPKIAGPGDRLVRARDEHELYFRSHPQHTDREYLLSIFGELVKLPGTRDIFGEHNAINDLPNWLSGDAAGELLSFFQKINASTGELVHDFTDPNWDTRFLGDLYQDLSEAARKKFALLQTPDFVEEFILDRTLDPAIEEFGLVPPPAGNEETAATRFRMIDPACGSGHFLLGAFPRLLDRWQRKEPGTNVRELTQRALNSIHGVDINPFAVAIAKFRLLLVAMKACDIQRLSEAPAFQINVACGDSLLHGENRTSTGQNLMDFADGATDQELYAHAYPGEDLNKVRTLLRRGTYHCVVANPPYIVPKDRKLNDWYRKRFSACHMKYSLAVPFMQQIFQLAVQGGFTGQITANSFMKREFGRKLIESFFPSIDLTHVIDTSGAYIPGHGTPTTILFGRNRDYVGTTLRTVLGIRGEPSTPEEPARGLVWSSIVSLTDQSGKQNEYVSSGDSERSLFQKHPWSIGGGGASEFKDRLESNATCKIEQLLTSIGFMVITGEDEAFALPESLIKKKELPFKQFCTGDVIRDWEITPEQGVIYPYDDLVDSVPSFSESEAPNISRFLWRLRTVVRARNMFGKTIEQHGFRWYEYIQFIRERVASSNFIVFPFVASHNHFLVQSGMRCFNRSAPVILCRDNHEANVFAIAGLLNSSLACFWMKQVSQQKQLTGGDGVRVESRAVVPYEFSGTQLVNMPIPDTWNQPEWKIQIARLAKELQMLGQRSSFLRTDSSFLGLNDSSNSMRNAWSQRMHERKQVRSQMIALQEELDFTVYSMWNLCDKNLIGIDLDYKDAELDAGQRPFEMLSGKNDDGFPVLGTMPDHWAAKLNELWELRMAAIQISPELQLVEDSHYKRRWRGRQGLFNHTEHRNELGVLCYRWLIDRVENYFDLDGRMKDTSNASEKLIPLADVALYSIAQLADAARRDPQFMEVGELYRDDPAFDVQALVEELVAAESVPHLPILRYKDSGLRKRAEWEKTWDLQRREDEWQRAKETKGQSGGENTLPLCDSATLPLQIPVPPKYTSADFISTGGARYWSLRGKLDVPKERWISFPHCEGPDGTLVICWAGYDHLQQAQAISAYYVRVQTEFGGSDDPRLIPLLASLIELLPWLKQWHNEPNANFDGLRMGDYFEGFVNEEARALGKTLDEIRAWTPPKGQRGRVAKGQSGKRKGQSRKGSKGQSEEGAAEA
jgi:hypothetical protein